jgi:hypothetical protein
MLLPLTFKVDPTGALIMLAGIYYGAQYGGSTTAILVNIPGEATAVVTTLDGHAMARKGQAGIALGIAAMASFFAGTVATLVIAAIGAPAETEASPLMATAAARLVRAFQPTWSMCRWVQNTVSTEAGLTPARSSRSRYPEPDRCFQAGISGRSLCSPMQVSTRMVRLATPRTKV